MIPGLDSGTGYRYTRKTLEDGVSRHVAVRWQITRPRLPDGTRGDAKSKVESVEAIAAAVKSTGELDPDSPTFHPTKRKEVFLSLRSPASVALVRESPLFLPVLEAQGIVRVQLLSVDGAGPHEATPLGPALASSCPPACVLRHVRVEIDGLGLVKSDEREVVGDGVVGERGRELRKGEIVPDGVILVKDVISEAEEDTILRQLDAVSPEHGPCWESGISRRVQHFGAVFDYKTRRANPITPTPPSHLIEPTPLPKWLQSLQARISKCYDDAKHARKGGSEGEGGGEGEGEGGGSGGSGDVEEERIVFEQVTANEYLSGQGIRPHVDTRSAFGPVLASLSLGASAVMEFRPQEGESSPLPRSYVWAIDLPPRSVLFLTGDARNTWSHAIPPRLIDCIDGKTRQRDRRVSLTFRSLLPTAFDPPPPDDPDAPPASFHSSRLDSPSPTSTPAPTVVGPPAPAVEKEFVHQFYETAAEHFSDTRHTPWPRVAHFVASLRPGCIVADLGCGNGRLMVDFPTTRRAEAGDEGEGGGEGRGGGGGGGGEEEGNRALCFVGLDASHGLLSAGRGKVKGLPVVVGDATHVALRDGCADAAMSIAVLHHISTLERRRAVISEIARVLRPGGEALVQAWAREQPATSKRTFRDENVMVPWKLDASSATTLHRFCHVFHKGELEELATGILDVIESWYEKGNWCMLLRKPPATESPRIDSATSLRQLAKDAGYEVDGPLHPKPS